MEQAINWFTYRQGKVTYSMTHRNGPGSYDCSSAEYYSLIEASIFPAGIRIGNTDSLFGDLERHGFVQVPAAANGYIETKRGDIFIWGARGASSGAAGHTGTFLDHDNIIHCAYGYNGIHTDNHDYLWGINGYPPVTVYRYVGTPQAPGNPHDQNVDIGSYIRFDKAYRVDDVQLIGGIWQIRTNELCKIDFTWAENGIPAEPVYEVDGEGYKTPDQNLDPGSLYKIPGKYKILDLSEYKGMWIAMIEWNGLKFWVDVETATEVPESDPGTPVPGVKPTPPPSPPQQPPVQPEPPKGDVQPEPPLEPPVPPKEPESQPPIETPQATKPKENDMAFTKAQQKELKIATEKAEDIAREVAASEIAKELVSGVTQKTKLKVYIIGDTLIGLGIIAPNVAIVAGWDDVVRIVALSSIFTAAGAFLLTMFGIYKSKK